MKLSRPSHATVVAYLALLVALGGSAYAAIRIGSEDIINNSLRSKDLADGKAVSGKDVKQSALSGEHIRENRLEASKFTAFASGAGGCEALSAEGQACAEATVRLPTASRVFAVATGSFSAPAAAEARCELAFDGIARADADVGQSSPVHVDSARADGFALTAVSDAMPPGDHQADLICRGTGNPTITDVTISAFGIGEFR